MADNTRQLSSSALVINNEVVEYKAETLDYTLGLGTSVSNVVNQGGAAKRITGENVQEQFAKVMFEMQTTEFNRDSLVTWKRNDGLNAIEVTDTKTGSVLVYQNATLVNDPSIKEASDGTISVEFEADSPISL